MRIPGVKTAKVFSRWLRARILGGALILGYHRVAPTAGDSYEVCVSPDHFAEHLDILRKYTCPTSLSRLVQHLREDSLPPKSVAVTFDDGYADNLYTAKPLLDNYEVPATVFICTGYLGKEFWWDELERLIMNTQADIGALHLQAGDKRFLWSHPDASSGVGSLQEVSLRRRLRHELYHFLLTLDHTDQKSAMEILRDWSGLSNDNLSQPRALDQDELLNLAKDGLVDMGVHTRNHLMLPWLSLERQREEIISSKLDLETLLGRPVEGFAYPNGRSTKAAKQIVREAGFGYACTSLQDVLRPGDDLHELTRFWQKDVDGDKFLQNLKLWMGKSRTYAG